MSYSSDFEITDDGELVRYHGAGGMVVIPEGVRFLAYEGVFDPSLEITELHLPSTLLGHKYEPGCSRTYVLYAQSRNGGSGLGNGGATFGNGAATFGNGVASFGNGGAYLGNGVVLLGNGRGCLGNFGECDLAEAEGDGGPEYVSESFETLEVGDELFNVLCLELPHLKRYVVANGNLVYRALNGALVFGLGQMPSYVVDVPKCLCPNVRMDCSFREYMQLERDMRERLGPTIVVELEQDELSSAEIMQWQGLGFIGTVFDNMVIFYAPKALRLAASDLVGTLPIRYPFVIVAPHVDFSEGDNTIHWHAAMGIIYKPELYNEQSTQRALENLLKVESIVYVDGVDLRMSRICKCLKERWSHAAVNVSNPPNNDGQACIMLIDAVVYGTLDDVKKVLSYDFDFYGEYYHYWDQYRHGGREAIEMACRYGGLEKLVYLMEHEKFTTPRCGHERSVNELFYNFRAYWQIFGPKYFNNGLIYYHSPDGIELRDFEPLPVEERIKCFEYIISNDPYHVAYKGWLWFIAFMYGLDDLAEHLVADVDMDHFFYGIKDKGVCYDIEWALKSDIERGGERTLKLSKYMQARGHELCLKWDYGIEYVYNDPELATKIFENVSVGIKATKRAIRDLFDYACGKVIYERMAHVEHANESLIAILSSKRNCTSQMVRDYIEKAQKQGKSELVAALLNILYERQGTSDETFAKTGDLEL